MEVERQVKTRQIRPIISHQTVDGKIGLSNHDFVRAFVGDRSHGFDRGVHAWLIHGSDLQQAQVWRHSRPPIRVDGVITVLFVFMKMVNGVDAESIDTALKPEAQHIAHGPLDVAIAPIEIWLFLEVRVVVALPRRGVESPGGAAELAFPVVRRRSV